MIFVRSKTIFDYAEEKVFEYIYDKESDMVFSKDLGLIRTGVEYTVFNETYHVNRFYEVKGIPKVEISKVGQVSKHYYDLNFFLKFLWIEQASNRFLFIPRK